MAAWLGTWKYRRKVTVSNTNIDSSLTHFPLLLTLGTSVGTGSADVSSIFDELTSDANRTKIAFTKTDGTTQLYAEIEKWDDDNEKAVIWISKSDLVLASAATTDVYMYYDSAQAANTTYIGDTNADVAENVWDSNYTAVQHLPDGSSASATYDSTSNDNDGTKEAANEPIEIAGEVGEAQDFDGSNDYIDLPAGTTSSNPFGITDAFTVSAIIKVESLSDRVTLMDGQSSFSGTDAYNAGINLAISSDGTIEALVGKHTAANRSANSSSGEITTGTYYLLTMTGDDDSLRAYKDYSIKASETVTSGDVEWDGGSYNDDGNYIGKFLRGASSDDNFFNGIVDEFRISSIARPIAWIKANYYCLTDALVAWAAEEEYSVPAGDTGGFFAFF